MHALKNRWIVFSCVGVMFTGVLSFHAKPYITQSKLLLGTAVQITCQYPEAIKKAFEEIERVENLLSEYKENSQISLLNKNKYRIVDDETLYIIEKAKKIYYLSEGLFDITVGPLTSIWKKAIKSNEFPSKEAIEDALESVGSDRIEIDKEYSIVSIAADTQLDLGGIAKGYAIDSAIKKLKRLGVKSALINAGGDIYCLGTKRGRPWIVGIKSPRNQTKFHKVLKVRNKAVATSGDYEQFFMYKDKRYSHIIDPKTGYPVDNNVVSATVIAQDCLTADALATTVFIMGKEKGEEFIKNNFRKAEVEIVIKDKE